jgi:hypothetical protein
LLPEDTVGFIVDEDARDMYVYACDEHTPDYRRETHREVTRAEAADVDAICHDCEVPLVSMDAI